MFNDLNNQANPSHQAVDDIFAETDKPAANGIQSDIETHNVGLASTGEDMSGLANEQTTEKRNYLKIIIIVTLTLAVIGGIYLAYTQFFKNSGNTEATPIIDSQKAVTTNTVTPVKTVENNFVAAIPGIATTSVNPVEVVTPSSGEATSSEVGVISPAEEEVVAPVVSTVDSDNDSLIDEEEKTAGTNINVIDTDNDGLSDYEEVKIYHTNSLSADTDGDSYLDGAEVKGGYNPNGAGKLPGNSVIK